jgi:hypothetical protein
MRRAARNDTCHERSLVICETYAVRAAVAAMRQTIGRILQDGGIAGVKQDIASLSDIFALQGYEHLRTLERVLTLMKCAYIWRLYELKLDYSLRWGRKQWLHILILRTLKTIWPSSGQ